METNYKEIEIMNYEIDKKGVPASNLHHTEGGQV
jgi:hypothetical protein